MFLQSTIVKFLIVSAAFLVATITAHTQKTGIFDNHNDVGAVQHAGSATYDESGQHYQLSGSGSNIWFKHDELHFLWKKITGNFILQARGVLLGTGTDPHRKFGWMVRSNLDSSSAMVCSTVHGDGLTSLQYRRQAAADVEETRSSVKGPDVIQLERNPFWGKVVIFFHYQLLVIYFSICCVGVIP